MPPDILGQLESTWQRHGARDPLWAALTYPDKKGNRWTETDFFATGERVVGRIMASLDELGLRPPRGDALDFGCGPGRITRALAGHFDRVVGVDLASSMLEAGARFNRCPERVSYVLNRAPELTLFQDASFDMAISQVTLQHIKQPLSLVYVRELIRVLRPGGIAVLQVVTGAQPTFAGRATSLLPAALRSRVRGMGLYPLPASELAATVASTGATIVHTHETPAAGPRWLSLEYTLRK